MNMLPSLIIVVRLLLLLASFAPMRAAQTKAQLRYRLVNGSSSYVAFSGGLDVEYSIPANYSSSSVVFLRLLSLEPATQVLMNDAFSTASGSSGEFTISCGFIDHAGLFVFQLVDSTNHTLAEAPPLVVSWPKVSLSLPTSHVALSDEVVMGISVVGLQCQSAHSGTKYHFEVIYFGRNDTKDTTRVFEPKQTIHDATLRQLDLFNADRITLNCAMFDQEGVYQAFLRADKNAQVPVAVSNEMVVRWSPVYRLTANVGSVIPCSKSLTIQYVQPKCSGRDDKIRLFQQLKRSATSPASPVDFRYVTERRAQSTGGASSVIFECGFFNEIAVGYCFQYISTANSGAVSEQTMLCLPTTRSSDVEFSS